MHATIFTHLILTKGLTLQLILFHSPMLTLHNLHMEPQFVLFPACEDCLSIRYNLNTQILSNEHRCWTGRTNNQIISWSSSLPHTNWIMNSNLKWYKQQCKITKSLTRRKNPEIQCSIRRTSNTERWPEICRERRFWTDFAADHRTRMASHLTRLQQTRTASHFDLTWLRITQNNCGIQKILAFRF